MPMQPAGNHQVQDQPVVWFDGENYSFADATEFSNFFAVCGAEWRIETSDQERFADADIVENLPADSRIDFLDIEIDVG